VTLAWHFVGPKLRGGARVPPDGTTLRHDGPLELCRSGYHASERLIDALRHAVGDAICRVNMGGELVLADDKLVARERTILWRVDGRKLLRDFARLCVLDVAHLWDAPAVTIEYLITGDWKIQGAARDAARAAHKSPKDTAAGVAAWAALKIASSFYNITTDTAGNAARDADFFAEMTSSIFGSVEGDNSILRDEAWYSVRASQNARLIEMVMQQHGELA